MALFPAALLARLLHHEKLVRIGRRKFWSWEFFWELPTAVFCAILGGSISEFFGLTGLVAYGVAGGVAWLGPRGLEVMAARWFKLKPIEEEER